MGENLAEIAGHPLYFFVVEIEVAQIGYVANLLIRQFHAVAFFLAALYTDRSIGSIIASASSAGRTIDSARCGARRGTPTRNSSSVTILLPLASVSLWMIWW